MKISSILTLSFVAFVLSNLVADEQATQRLSTFNPQIDAQGFLEESVEATAHRANRRVDVDTFIRMSGEKDTIILDTRSKDAYRAKHLKGAVHLNFSDITKGSLAKVIPSKDTRILIYCNNNFTNNSRAFARKHVTAALNVPTFITLYQYGYRNLFELGPSVDEHKTKLEFETAK